MSRVKSGYTEAIDDKRKKWYEKLGEKKLEWEELAAEESTNKLLKKLAPVPFSRYLGKYLLDEWMGGEDTQIICDEDVKELIEHITKRFQENGMPEDRGRERWIRDMLTGKQSAGRGGYGKKTVRRFFELSLGLGLPVEDVDAFLQNALKRAGFNYYDPEEMLVWCALRFCRKNHFRCYQALLRDYEITEPEEAEREKVFFSNTVEIRDEVIRTLTEDEAEIWLYETEEFAPDTLNPKLKRFFAVHKAAVPPRRTASVVFMELLNKFVDNNKGELLEFKAVDRGTEEYAEAKLRIVYKAGREICLPKGTVFYAEKGKQKRKICFILKEDIVLPEKKCDGESAAAEGTEEITVRAKEPSREGERLADKGAVCHMEAKPDEIISISNPKPVSRRKIKDTISIELIRDFLYGSGAYEPGNTDNINGGQIGQWFTETEITGKRFSDIQKQADSTSGAKRKDLLKSEARRSDIITLVFLNFCMDTDSRPVEEYVMEASSEAVYQDFVREVNNYLKKCAMMPFYLQNPYECLLAYLIQSDTPVDSLRNLWQIVKAGKDSTDDRGER